MKCSRRNGNKKKEQPCNWNAVSKATEAEIGFYEMLTKRDQGTIVL